MNLFPYRSDYCIFHILIVYFYMLTNNKSFHYRSALLQWQRALRACPGLPVTGRAVGAVAPGGQAAPPAVRGGAAAPRPHLEDSRPGAHILRVRAMRAEGMPHIYSSQGRWWFCIYFNVCIGGATVQNFLWWFWLSN